MRCVRGGTTKACKLCVFPLGRPLHTLIKSQKLAIPDVDIWGSTAHNHQAM